MCISAHFIFHSVTLCLPEETSHLLWQCWMEPVQECLKQSLKSAQLGTFLMYIAYTKLKCVSIVECTYRCHLGYTTCSFRYPTLPTPTNTSHLSKQTHSPTCLLSTHHNNTWVSTLLLCCSTSTGHKCLLFTSRITARYFSKLMPSSLGLTNLN